MSVTPSLLPLLLPPQRRIKVTRSKENSNSSVKQKKRELKWNDGRGGWGSTSHGLVILSSPLPLPLLLPPRRWDTLAERFDLSPLCPANKRDNFSNLNRTPFESTGWNELEHHYGGVKQIYPHARRGITRFDPRWEKKGSFFVFFIPLLVLLESELSKFEEV